MREIERLAERSILRAAIPFFRSGGEILAHDARGPEFKYINRLQKADSFGAANSARRAADSDGVSDFWLLRDRERLSYVPAGDDLRSRVPGNEYRPRDVELLRMAREGAHSPEELQAMRQSYAEMRSLMSKMPDGIPQSGDDMKKILPLVNPLNDRWNCVEVGMAVDDIQAGHAAIAGRSVKRADEVMPYRVDGTSNIYHYSGMVKEELLRAGDGSRGVVTVIRSGGNNHLLNTRNFKGMVVWIDGQDRLISDAFPYLGGFDHLEFLRTDQIEFMA